MDPNITRKYTQVVHTRLHTLRYTQVVHTRLYASLYTQVVYIPGYMLSYIPRWCTYPGICLLYTQVVYIPGYMPPYRTSLGTPLYGYHTGYM